MLVDRESSLYSVGRCCFSRAAAHVRALDIKLALLLFLMLVMNMVRAMHGQAATRAAAYAGKPFADTVHRHAPQTVPGTVVCAYYDVGGEGVAYHDSDSQNHGSGELNSLDGSYLHDFRVHEGVDISYTKLRGTPVLIDDSPYNKVAPPENLLYVGWTVPGEWFRVTVEAERAGIYNVGLLYTSNRGGSISVDVDGRDATGPVQIPTTFDAAEPVAWRQWHHWNRVPDLFQVPLNKGRNVLTVHIVEQGNMNLALFDFQPAP